MAWKENATSLKTRAQRLQELQDENAKATRLQEIAVAENAAGFKNITVAQAENWINNKIDNASTVAETKEAMREILLKMVPYLLK